MKSIISFGVFLSLTIYLTSAQNCYLKTSDSTKTVNDSLVLFMQNTLFFSESFYCALEKYPELRDKHIEIKRKHIKTMMAARPEIRFLFKSKNNRHYRIFITDRPDMNADSIYSKLGNEVITGLFGHELSHLLDYTQRGNINLLFFAAGYYFNRREIEVHTDMIAIHRGFGEYLAKYYLYLQQSQLVNKKYKHKKSKYYLSEKEIEKNENNP